MVAVGVSIDTSLLNRAFSVLQARIAAEGVYLKLVGDRYLAWMNQNFRQAGAEHPWKPLSANTIASRRKGKGGGSAQPLRDTGRMAQSFVSEVQVGAVWVGTRDKKAEWHHFGTSPYQITTNPPGREARRAGGRPGALRFMTPAGPVYRREVQHPGLPARPLLPSQTLAEELARQELTAYLEEAAKAAG